MFDDYDMDYSLDLDGADVWLVEVEDERAALRAAYVGAAITEIATLRAELSGPQWG